MAINLVKGQKIDLTKRPTSYEVDLLTFAFLLHFGSESPHYIVPFYL